LTFDTGSTSYPAVSRDGKLVVYASDRSGRGDYDIYVQPLSGGHAMRLTDHEARDYSPDISPDGSLIAFHSYRDGSGVYVVPITGGPQKRIADGGDNPRFSPDGSQVAFDLENPDGTYAICTVPASGGRSKRLTNPDFRYARGPLWTPDGRFVLFVGAMHSQPDRYDWWAAPSDGGTAIQTGVSQTILRQRLPPLRFFHRPLDWIGNDVVFSYSGGAHVNLWRISLASPAWQTAGVAGQLTSGSAHDMFGRIVDSGGRLFAVVASGNRQTHLHSFEFDPERAMIAGSSRQLTRDLSLRPSLLVARPSVSASGNLLVYASRRAGNDGIWIQDLRTGEEKALEAGPQPATDPIVSADGTAVVFMRVEGNRRPILIVSSEGGQPRLVCDDCGAPTSWSADGRFVLYDTGTERLGLLDLRSSQHTEMPASVPVIGGSFSPDGRTVAIGVRLGERERAFLVPLENGAWPPQQSWIPLTDLQAAAVSWAPGGYIAYFLSLEDNYRCLWAQHINAQARRPWGRAFPVKHFHSVQGYPQMSRWIAITRNTLFLRLTSENMNLWSVELR
jgi:Tol biopolymer transport system component